jgi:small multidrug resistance family-3 protein
MAGFGRVYATHGEVLIVMVLIWACKVNGFKPDRWDIIGAAIALAGACIIIYICPEIKRAEIDSLAT